MLQGKTSWQTQAGAAVAGSSCRPPDQEKWTHETLKSFKKFSSPAFVCDLPITDCFSWQFPLAAWSAGQPDQAPQGVNLIFQQLAWGWDGKSWWPSLGWWARGEYGCCLSQQIFCTWSIKFRGNFCSLSISLALSSKLGFPLVLFSASSRHSNIFLETG